MDEEKTQRYVSKNLAKLNCFSRFLYSICSFFLEKTYDFSSTFMSKKSKRKYDQIMENITEEEKYTKINHMEAIEASRAVRLFIYLLDALIAIPTIGLAIAAIIFYFRNFF
jgi:hypothetical protein